MTPGGAATLVVIDTNIVLDLFVFDDPVARPLRSALADGLAHWLATARMREELCRVLAYPHIARRLTPSREAAVLADFDAHARLIDEAPRAAFICRDPDDQPFIDLACWHRAVLASKDKEVLRLARRLAGVGVRVGGAAEVFQTGPNCSGLARRQ